MAKVYAYPKLIEFNEGIATETEVVISDTTLGCNVVLNGADDKGNVYSVKDESLLLVLENTNTSVEKVTIKAGTAWAGVANKEIEIPASGKSLLRLEGAKYKHVSGEDKGCVVIVPATASKIKVTAYNLK